MEGPSETIVPKRARLLTRMAVRAWLVYLILTEQPQPQQEKALDHIYELPSESK